MYIREPEEWNGVNISTLKPKQKAFCQEYIIDMNGFRAADAVGYAKRYSWELLKDERIQAYISYLAEQARTDRVLSARDVMERLTLIAEGKSKEPIATGKGVQVYDGTYARDRLKALELLGKRYALFTDKVQHNGDVEISVGFTEDEEED
ncbi:terminase small subunit [Bacillus thuringiensis]